MRMRNPKDKDELLNGCDYYYEDNFNNDNKICLEIGMGKGQFILNMALENPETNYIGVEKFSSVASVAIKKINQYKPNNLKILVGDIANLVDTLEGKIDTIYLNFSDPWPKKRHAKRRLTSHLFLEKYDNIFKFKKEIIQKTDNINLFSYSISSLSTYGYTLDYVTLDLLSENDPDNVLTEYESKFNSKGVRICKLVAHKD